jgi:uncharacterized protein YraI
VPGVSSYEEEFAMKLRAVFVTAMLLTPTAALAAPGIVTTSVGMRAGPGPGFPVVDRIPGGSRVNIHGCLRGNAWCDVSWSGDRGWVSSQYLEYLYRNRYVLLRDYADDIDIPVVPFVLSSYWSSHYAGRPWYHRRAYWSGYWQSHARFATRIPVDRSADRLGRTETRAAITEGRTRTGIAPPVTRQQDLANIRGEQGRMAIRGEQGRMAIRGEQGRMAIRGEQGRMAPVTGADRTLSRPPQAMARGHEANRFSATPAARPSISAPGAQPNVGRVGGPPMNAQAQMPRAAPAMPQGGGGGAHINAAPRGGGGGPSAGGPPAGGPPGHQRR